MVDCGLSEKSNIRRRQRIELFQAVQILRYIVGEAGDIIVAEIAARRHGARIELALDLDRTGEAMDDNERHIIALHAARFLEGLRDERRGEARRTEAAFLMAGDAI